MSLIGQHGESDGEGSSMDPKEESKDEMPGDPPLAGEPPVQIVNEEQAVRSAFDLEYQARYQAMRDYLSAVAAARAQHDWLLAHESQQGQHGQAPAECMQQADVESKMLDAAEGGEEATGGGAVPAPMVFMETMASSFTTVEEECPAVEKRLRAAPSKRRHPASECDFAETAAKRRLTTGLLPQQQSAGVQAALARVTDEDWVRHIHDLLYSCALYQNQLKVPAQCP